MINTEEKRSSHLNYAIILIGLLILMLLFVVSSETALLSPVGIDIHTNKQSYSKNEEVFVYGNVYYYEQTVIDVPVEIKVYDPSGKLVLTSTTYTNNFGKFSLKFSIKDNWIAGKYEIYARARITPTTIAVGSTYFYVKEKTTIILNAPSQTTLKTKVKINGYIKPSPGVVNVEVIIKGSTERIIYTTTDKNGYFEIYVIFNETGTYYILAKWPGNDYYEGAESSTLSIIVKKLSSSISVSLSPKRIRYGSSVKISGKISPDDAGSYARVHLSYRIGSTTYDIATVQCDASGHFTYIWKPNIVGNVVIIASWSGNDKYTGASASTSLKILKGISKIIISTNSTSVSFNSSVLISGTLKLVSLNTAVEIVICGDNYNKTFSVQVNNGKFNLIWKAKEPGTYKIYALWKGNLYFEGCISNMITMKVRRIKTNIVINSIENHGLGSFVRIIGSLKDEYGKPINGALIVLKIIKPNNETITKETLTNNDGKFNSSILADVTGYWKVVIRYPGCKYYYSSLRTDSFFIEGNIAYDYIKYSCVLRNSNNITVTPYQTRTLKLYYYTNCYIKNALLDAYNLHLLLASEKNTKKGILRVLISDKTLKENHIVIDDVKVYINGKPVPYNLHKVGNLSVLEIQFLNKLGDYLNILINFKHEVSIRIIDLQNETLPGAIIEVLNSSDNSLINASITNREGMARFFISKANYRVRVYWMNMLVYDKCIPLYYDNITLRVNVTSLKLQIRGLSGFPASGTVVKLILPNGKTYIKYASSSGVVYFNKLPLGKYKIEINSLSKVIKTVILNRSELLELSIITWVDLIIIMSIVAIVILTNLIIRKGF